ncbi:MAG TPA: glycosyltransferase family 2 protein, partial [Methylomirabilota bacterium]|nr:glycosyltransferase family 2 protein [Methylomirabilota bacterium]
FFNIRASIKLALDWRGMLVTTRFVREAYARLSELPTEEQLEREPAVPVFLHLVPAYQEPDIAVTLRALTASRYPHGRLHVVVVTKEEEERAPHPAMGASTGELVRRLRETLPPYQQKRLSHVVMPGPGRKAHQLNWALRPDVLREVLGEETDPARVFVGVSDADSIPDPDTYRWIARRELGGQGSLAYQGIPLSLANYDRLPIRGKICAIQQSSIFIRVSIARLLNEVKRVRLLARLSGRLPRLAWLIRPAFELCFRRSQICLGHNQFVRLDLMQAIGGFPTSGATEDSTLGYELGRRGVLIQALPMVEVTDLPETSEGVIRQNARWYRGVLDDIPYLWRVWRTEPTAFNLAQLVRHVGNKMVEWPIAALVYPVTGWLGWYLAYHHEGHRFWFYMATGAPTVSLLLTVWVGGIMTQALIEDLRPYLPRPVDLRRKSLKEKFLGTFRCQTYWLLATRGAWRVLWALARTGRFEPAKTDRIARRALHPSASALASPGRASMSLSPLGRGQGEGS